MEYYCPMLNIKIKQGKPYPSGASINRDGSMNIAAAVRPGRELSIILNERNSGKKAAEINIAPEYKIGDIYCVSLEGISFNKYTYTLYDGHIRYVDPYAKKADGCHKWGIHEPACVFPGEDEWKYEWEDDRPLKIPYDDMLLYMLHVRGFTKHSSSQVKAKGCFEGIVEKIPYLKELGINHIELMPAYEFNEVISPVKTADISAHIPKDSPEYKELEALKENKEKELPKINYWGFANEALYMCPKAAYSYGKDSSKAFKDMVKALHKNGIGVIMQFYFAKDPGTQFVTDCLTHWVIEYHVDGFHLMGNDLQLPAITGNPILSDTKMFLQDLSREGTLYEGDNPYHRNIALCRDDYMNIARRFLKSDEDMLGPFTRVMLENPQAHGVVNYITNYYGFTLNDLVSYERKHNEENGEDNKDGGDYNFSWNCGCEGISRKKNIKALRKKQMKNILSFMYTSMGIPMLVMGDEFGNTQKGNNNAYCQDNRITWLDWKDAKNNQEQLEFVKRLIAFRKSFKLFNTHKPKSLMDRSGSGFPEFSFHAEQAFYPHFENYNRHIGCMLTGENEYVYIAYNMYWDVKGFALPRLPKDYEWKLVMDTGSGFFEAAVDNSSAGIITEDEDTLIRVDNISVKERSVCILKGVKQEKKAKKNKSRNKTVKEVM